MNEVTKCSRVEKKSYKREKAPRADARGAFIFFIKQPLICLQGGGHFKHVTEWLKYKPIRKVVKLYIFKCGKSNMKKGN